jgi:hypothetical protein
MVTIPLSLLIDRGLEITPAEAVAIVQALASSAACASFDDIEVDSDGSVRCRSSQGAADVAGLAALLDRLLPKSGVPAPLRYTIARGLGLVEAPAFESIDDFSRALVRFESGDRTEIIRGLLARARPPRPVAPARRPTEPAPAAAPAPPRRVARAEPAARVQRSVAPALAPPRLPRRSFLPLLYVAAALVLSATGGYAVVDFALSRQTRPPIIASAPTAASSTPPSESAAPAPASAVDTTKRPDVRRAALRSNTPVPLLPPAERAYSPAFSSNGTALFFQTGGRTDATSAIAMTETGSGMSDDLRIMKIVDDGSRNYHAQPSPDGRFVAFDSDRGGVRAVYVAEHDGSNVRRISGDGYAALPTWSPDGSRLAFVRAEPDRPSVWNLWIQPLAGGAAERITEYRYGQTWAASWFPDGHRIAYSHETDLVIFDLTNGRMTVVVSPVHGRLVRTPAVSPDGSRIVFQVFRAGAWMLNLADGSMQCVLADPTAEEFAWAPDGRRFAFHSRQDGRWGVYMLSAPATS